MKDSERVRRPAVAGAFYPGDPAALRANLNKLLGGIDTPPPAGRPIAIVAPHAGYQYSGRVAAHGYRLLLNRDITTAVVISPSHLEYFSGVSVFAGDAYETPLGPVHVDTALADEITAADPLIERSLRGHAHDRHARGEHALEVQLPFLQAVQPNCSVVPIVMGDQSWEYCRALGDALAPHVSRPDIVIIASSDLSHFYADEVARKLDGVFLEKLTDMDPWRLYESVKAKSCEACGAGPVIASLIAAAHSDTATCRVLSTATSGDVTGDRSQVVGYASAVLLEAGDAPEAVVAGDEEEFSLDTSERSYLLRHARHAIERALGVEAGDAPSPPQSSRLQTSRGGFITLKSRKRLRGCIGTLESEKPIPEMVSEMACAAAFKDPRFPVLARDEVPDIDIEISILSPPMPIAGPDDIVVGRHGLIVEKGGRRGLLLPQVAEEYGWDAVTFLERTSEKAGLVPDAWRDESARIYAFTATVFGEGQEIQN